VGTNGLTSWAELHDDYTDVNSFAYDKASEIFTLDDTDNDTDANGKNAVPTTTDLDYRDDVAKANALPVAVDDNLTMVSGNILTLLPLTGDSDADTADELTIKSINGVELTAGTAQEISVTNGVVNIDEDGVITFTPTAGYTGDVSFPYVIDDGTTTATANVNVTVTSDTDGDGVPNHIDLDDDNDGVLDRKECPTPPRQMVFKSTNDSLRSREICDSDSDGIKNHLDLDSDNDGIPDNVEAQTTQNYQAPSGAVDANGTYIIYGPNGITPVDTDGDNVTDMLDSDSDDDNITDCQENNDAISTCPITNVSVGTNGLASWAEMADNYADTNGLAHSRNFTLDDTDNDTLANGTDANATTKDLDYRDDVSFNSPPVATDVNRTIDIGSTTTIDLLSLVSDSNGGDTLSITTINGVVLTGNEQNITVPHGRVEIGTDGNVTFVPDNGYTGASTFAYQATDGTATVSANV
ncbi:MAG: cadherin-like domain-containing protein, partial [Sulfurovaceae bacterium]|nr:cadherin-like domain-containing protein [Sulfurovaceae bacterium]